jgi:alpha-1,3-rhamnosyl/mannosyltransferase
MTGLGLATMVITPSEAVRRQAIARFRIHPGRIAAVPHAAAAHFRPVAGPRPMAPYFLYAGVLEPRKNLDMLLGVWREVYRRHGVELVLAGRVRKDYRSPAPEPGLHLLGEVPDQDLPALYSGAVACLYPSLYEGFGLPVLEAMQCGALVIASRDPAISEVAGEAAILLDAHAPAAWMEAMVAAALSPESRPTWRGRALDRAKLFSWGRTARLTREVYLEALARFGE